VVAKAPVPGRCKTRLGATIGLARAAEVAAAALLDTLDAAEAAFGADRCVLALDGDLSAAVRGADIADVLSDWHVVPQRGEGFGARLAAAHADSGPGPVVQIGMDTPHVSPDLLVAVEEALAGHQAVLGPAPDGGWWVLGLRETRHAQVLVDVAMSTPDTCTDTRVALIGVGVSVGLAPTLRDVDTATDAAAVAVLAPTGRFARLWTDLIEERT
jgi:uncharacterized protein